MDVLLTGHSTCLFTERALLTALTVISVDLK